ncbi:MAG: type IV toxin-antitoxin system AbiEi family antitoxin domain-containing protein, partial [Actinobacteria bacterium]|nr:type IV toxin-antitoxin system AbiEi family antitoxin domain-containing protein [Actinomycetota bacterium]
ITRAVIEHARRNGGVVTRAEALALGLSPTTLARRVQDGVLARVARGVYALPGASEPNLVILEGACRKLGSVVSHQSAAAMHTLDRYQQRETIS